MKKLLSIRILPALLCLLLFVSLLPVQAHAAGAIDTNRTATLTIDYRYDSAALSDAQFEAYKVASVSPYGEFTPTAAFAGYPVSMDGLDASGWNRLAMTLKGYVQADNLTPFASDKTDAYGRLRFTMKPGLYLIIGKGITKGGYSYTCAPFMVCLPDMDMVNNGWIYDTAVSPKTVRDMDYDPLAPATITRKVLKVWKDNGHTADRPKEITVQLFCDGKVYDTVTLNEKNNWRYTWDALERGHDWTVVEKEVSGYTVKITQEGQTFVVTNTNKKPPVTPPPASGASGNKLPQTGVLWWPVPILLISGLFFVTIGLCGRRKRNDA